MKASSSLRVGFLLVLLVCEVAWVASLRAFGWGATNGGIRWTSCLVGAVMPLIAAAAVLGRHRLRFNLRTMLVAMALVATFLALSVRPLQNAVGSRQGSRSLLASGATLHTKSSWDNVYAQLKYDPRPAAVVPVNPELAFWLRPLAGGLLNIPIDNTVREIWLSSDEQVEELCRNFEKFSNLERISINSGVTPAGAETLRQSLPAFSQLTDLHLNIDVQKDWFQLLRNIPTLSLWAEAPPAGRRLSDQQLRDIAALPDLRVLWIFKYAVTDADAQILAGSKSLKHVIFRKTAVTQSGEEQLSAALPGCVVHRD